jgi:nucleoside-diphosphate-sugar epimerase
MSELVIRPDLGDRYFIVGGVGFIGSHFVDRLLVDPSVACSSNNRLRFALIVSSEYP